MLPSMGAPLNTAQLFSLERRDTNTMMKILSIVVLAAALVGLGACAKESKPAPAPASTGLSK